MNMLAVILLSKLNSVYKSFILVKNLKFMFLFLPCFVRFDIQRVNSVFMNSSGSIKIFFFFFYKILLNICLKVFVKSGCLTPPTVVYSQDAIFVKPKVMLTLVTKEEC